MTEQEVFKRAWDHFLVKKRRPGWDKDWEICVYGGKGLPKCAIGILLPKDAPFEALNEAGSLCQWSPRLIEQYIEPLGVSFRFLERLQSAHDGAFELPLDERNTPEAGRARFRSEMEELAHDFHLKLPDEKEADRAG